MSKITFSKMVHEHLGERGGQITIFADGAEVGSIDKISTQEEITPSSYAKKWVVEEYEVWILPADLRLDCIVRSFIAWDHPHARAALAAAKQWARDTLRNR